MAPFKALANLSGVILIVVAVWAILFGGAYMCRVTGGWSTRSCVAIVAAGYIGLAAFDFSWFGLDTEGYLGAIGMLVPCTAAIAMAMIAPHKSRAE
nr:hypothetical protein [uncultured Rhodopila sp.]